MVTGCTFVLFWHCGASLSNWHINFSLEAKYTPYGKCQKYRLTEVRENLLNKNKSADYICLMLSLMLESGNWNDEKCRLHCCFTHCTPMLTNAAIIVSTSGESMTQERKTAQSKNNAYIMRVLVDCFTAGRQEQHKLHVSEQQQHATYTTHTHNTLTHYCCLHKQLMLCLVMWWQTGQECLHLSKHTRSLECMHAQKDKKFDKQCLRSIYQIGRGIKMSTGLSWGFRLWKIADWLFSCVIFIWYTILKCTINLKSLWVASIQPSSLNFHYTAVT